MRTLVGLLRLWRVYVYLDLLFVARDTRRFCIFLISDTTIALTLMTAAFLLAERFGGIGPFTKLQVAFMLGYGQVLVGLLEILFGYNISYISRRVGRGQLDHSLVQPHSLLTTFLTEGFAPLAGLGLFLPGAVLLVWAASSLGIELTPRWLALFLLLLLASGAIEMAFHFTWGALAFWAPRGAEEVSSETHHLLGQLRPFPLDGIGPAGQGALLSIVPVGFLAWYPSRALLGLDTSVLGLALTPVAAVASVAIATLVFRRGLAHYAQTGSTRYTDFGHRR